MKPRHRLAVLCLGGSLAVTGCSNMSQNEWLRQEVLSCQGNVSAVRDIFTGFQAALKVRLEGLGLTEQQDRQVDGLVRPALAAMKNVLNKAYTEGLSSEDVRAVRFD